MNQDRTQLLGADQHDVSDGVENDTNDVIESVVVPNVSDARTFPQYLAALSASLSALLSGVVMGWTAPVMDVLLDGKFNNIPISTSQMGWVGSFTTLGAMTMCIPTGFICDLIGRKKTILLIGVPFVTGWLMILFSKTILFLYLGRLFSGMGFGAACVAAPIYISEISDKKIRGTLGSLFQLLIGFGILVAYVTGSFLSPVHFTIFCAVSPVLFVLLFACQPESPVYLVRKGHFEDAEKMLKRLRGAQTDVTEELREIEGVLKESGQSATSIFQTFKRYSNLKALLIAFALMFFQQFCGVNAVIVYSTKIFSSSGVKLDERLCTITLGLIQFVATLFSSCFVDKLGRRVLMITSCLVAGLSTLLLAVYLTLTKQPSIGPEIIDKFGLVPIVSLGIFMTMFSIGLGPLPWLISSEIFPPEAKSIACSGAGTLNMFLAFVITKFFLDVSDIIGEDSAFYIFTFFSFLGATFTYCVLPETKGRSIEDIQFELSH